MKRVIRSVNSGRLFNRQIRELDTDADLNVCIYQAGQEIEFETDVKHLVDFGYVVEEVILDEKLFIQDAKYIIVSTQPLERLLINPVEINNLYIYTDSLKDIISKYESEPKLLNCIRSITKVS